MKTFDRSILVPHRHVDRGSGLSAVHYLEIPEAGQHKLIILLTPSRRIRQLR